jgi:hypothetical protein
MQYKLKVGEGASTQETRVLMYNVFITDMHIRYWSGQQYHSMGGDEYCRHICLVSLREITIQEEDR